MCPVVAEGMMVVWVLGVVAVAFHMTLSNSIGGETFTNIQNKEAYGSPFLPLKEKKNSCGES